MYKRKFRLPSPALVISMVTLSLVLGGTAFAASTAKHKDARADTKLVKKLAPKLSVKHAKTATNANHANTADNATTATTADNATNLGGQPASAYLTSSDVQSGTFFLDPGTTGKVLFTDGPLSVTADCTQRSGVTTVNVNIVSTAANWIWFGNTLEAAAGPVKNDTENDSSSPGTFKGSIDRLEAIAPSGEALHGQDAFGVNYPSAGKCYVSAWVNAL
jgi:hypothetical protein